MCIGLLQNSKRGSSKSVNARLHGRAVENNLFTIKNKLHESLKGVSVIWSCVLRSAGTSSLPSKT